MSAYPEDNKATHAMARAAPLGGVSRPQACNVLAVTTVVPIGSRELLQQLRQLQKQGAIKSTRRQTQCLVGIGIGTIGPLPCDAKAAAA